MSMMLGDLWKKSEDDAPLQQTAVVDRHADNLKFQPQNPKGRKIAPLLRMTIMHVGKVSAENLRGRNKARPLLITRAR